MSIHSLFTEDLRLHIKGEVLSDKASLGMYATDASLYQIFPVAVVIPKHNADVISAHKIARDHGISILPRGGGTSLAGQTVGNSMILDFSKYMNKILEFNPEEKWVRVQPGLIRDQLNKFLEPHGLHFAPDPATSSRANIGGMIGNNSSGTKSIIYGKTVDHLLGISVVLSDGTQLKLESLEEEKYILKAQLETREGEIYKTFRKLVIENKKEIIDSFPKVMRRVQGYNLDEFVNKNNWNLSKIICGSEGTLATTLEARIRLEPLPKFKSICVVHFEDMMEAIKAVKTMLEFRPSAVEILDNTVIRMSRENLTTQRHAQFVVGNPAAVQIVEFYGNSKEEVLEVPEEMVKALKLRGLGYAYPIFPEGPSYEDVWMIRKKGLGLMLGVKGDKKAIAFIEDASIPIDVLPEYIEKVVKVCDRNQTKAAVYAHASVGVIHVRPFLDMRVQEDIERFKRISEETFELVKEYGGSWSGEHGDGLVRSYYLERYFGKRVYNVLCQVKDLFDPDGLMNPGKIINAPPIDEDLRYGAEYRDTPMKTVYKYRDDGGFEDAVHMCTGVGECRKMIGGTMCPSFKATRDEEHSTRGRANALRLAMSGQLDSEGITSPRLKEVLDLCLSCKACKSECPSNVDMAKLKSEVLQKHYDKNGISLRDLMIKNSSGVAAWLSGPLAPVFNRIMASSVARWLLQKFAGFDQRRITPSYASQSFASWYQKNNKAAKDNREKVVLFADTYLNYHEPAIGIAAYKLLNKCGLEVILADVGCCQRPKISHGFLKDAKKNGSSTASSLKAYIDQGIKILVCEPSCYSALVDDLSDLIDDEDLAHKLKEFIVPIDVFVAELFKKERPELKVKPGIKKVLIHGHCHHKALVGTSDVRLVLDQVHGIQIEELPTGCCGMAGSFGYETEHFDLSRKIADDILVPAVNAADDDSVIVANGFSCRHQIKDFSDRKASHWLEILEWL